MVNDQFTTSAIFIAFLLLFQFSLIGQSGMYNIKHIQVKDGLPSSEVYMASQDKNGFIWFGTDAGLARFDGYRFTTYTQNEGLSNNSVIRVLADGQNRIWALTIKSLSCIEKDTAINLKDWDVPSGSMIYYVLEDPNQDIWFASSQGIYQLKNGSKKIEKFKHPLICDPVDLESRYYPKGIDSEGYLWIAEPNRYWELGMHPDSDSTTIRHYNSSVYPRMRYLLIHPNYIFNDKTIYKFNDQNQLEEVFRLNKEFKVQEISQLEEVNKDEIIISTAESGLFILKKENGAFKIKTNVLQNERITSFLRDREGNLWICTMGNGVFLLKKSSLNIANYKLNKGISGKNVAAVFTQNQELFLGYTNGNIDILQDLRIKKQIELRKNRKSFEKVRSIIPYGNNNILLSSDSGIFLYQDGKIRASQLRFAVKDLWADKDLNLYIAEANRTCFVPNYEFEEFMKASNSIGWEIRDGRAYAVIKYQNKTLIGTAHGLYQETDNGFENLAKLNPVFGTSISKLSLFQDSILIIVTDGAGVVITNFNQTEIINKSNGLSSDFCNNISIKDEVIWVATNNGITKISNFNFLKNDYNLHRIGYPEGLGSNEINDIKVENGTVYVGTNKGLSVFKESDMKPSNITPEVSIGKFQANGKNLDFDQKNTLDFDQNNIKIDFVGIQFQSLGEITYKYRMIGLEDDWQTTTNNSLNFHGLTAGNYKFEVKALNSNRVESVQVASAEFCITAPFWKQWWFYTLLLLALCSLAYIIIRLMVIEQQKNKLSKIVEHKTNELKEKIEELEFSNGQLVESNEQLEKFAYIASHDLQEPLRTIGSFITLLKRKYEDRLDETAMEYIDFAVNGTVRMKQLIQSLLQYSRLENNAVSLKKTNIDDLLIIVKDSLHGIISTKNAIVSNDPMPTIWVDPFQITQLIQNLVNNAIKFNVEEKPMVHVAYKKTKDGHQFSVFDNGIGIEKEYEERIFSLFQRLNPSQEFPGTGVGLAICKKVVTRHHGTIWVEANQPKGTIFHFTIHTTEPVVEKEKEVEELVASS